MSKEHVIHAFLKFQDNVFEEKPKEIEQTSENSNLPSSKENPWKEKRKNKSREKGEKKTWWQKWHKWITREYEEPTETIDIKPTHCSITWKELTERNCTFTMVSKRIVVDVEINKKVSEYVIREAKYRWHVTAWELPKWIRTSNMQLWPVLSSIVLYGSIYQKIPQERMCHMLKEIFKTKVTQGTINNMLKNWWQKAKAYYDEILNFIKTSACVWSDETGNKVKGKLMRIRIRQTTMWNYYFPSMNRAYETIQKVFGSSYLGVLVHDCYGAQNKTNAWAHQLCLEHIKRALKYSVEEGHKVAWEMLVCLRKSRKAQKWLIDGSIKLEYQERIVLYYENRMRELCLCCEGMTGQLKKTAKQIMKHMEKMFVFLQRLYVPRHNNWSERWLRMEKLHEKISWGFRSYAWAEIHCMILSLIESMKKQWRSVMEMLYNLVIGEFVLVKPE